MKKLLPILLYSIAFGTTSCKKDVSTTPPKPVPVVIQQDTTPVQISIYPNPCIGGHFTIQTNSTTSQTVQIVNMLGQIMLTQIITGTTNIPTDNLTNGVYYINITTNGSKTVKKLVIQK